MKHTATEVILENIRYIRGMAAEYLKAYRKTKSEAELMLYKRAADYLSAVASTVAIYEGIEKGEIIKLAKNQRP